jgi:hypothetical protein
MKTIKQMVGLSGLLAVLAGFLLLLLFSVSPATAQTDTLDMTSDGIVLIKGSVRKVSQEIDTIIVKSTKAGRIQILVAPQVDFIGISSLADLKKGQQVKVWYSPVGEENRAVKVELLPDLGC